MKKNIYLSALLAATMLSSSAAVAAEKLKIRDLVIKPENLIKIVKDNGIESAIAPEVISVAEKYSDKQYKTLEEAIDGMAGLSNDQKKHITEELFQPFMVSLIDSKLGTGFTETEEFELLLDHIKSGDIESFANDNPKFHGLFENFDANELLNLAHNLVDDEMFDVLLSYVEVDKDIADSTSLEVKEHLQEQIHTIKSKVSSFKRSGISKEEIQDYYDQQKNSPEVQEVLKLVAKKVEKKVAALKASGASQEAINKYVNKSIAKAEVFFVDPDKVKKSSEFTPLQKQDTASTDSLLAASAQVSLVESVIDDRLASTVGISSGDEPLSYGMWVRAMFAQAKQGSYKLTPGYKLNQHGATIGFDFGEEDSRLGVAYSFVDSKVNAKDTGIKDKFKSHIGTVYGLYEFPNNMFIDGQIRYGVSKVRKARDNGNLGKDISTAKPTGTIFGGKLELGYDYELADKIHLIPTIGVSADQVKVKAYKEKDAGLNRQVAQRTASKTSALLGFRVSKPIENGEFTMIPELHANLIYAVKSKNPDTKVTLFEGMEPMIIPSAKMAKASYKIGGSVKFVKIQKIDLGIGYDLGLSKKFHSHSGYLNARYNF
jgi:outer membrane autotransporter protein